VDDRDLDRSVLELHKCFFEDKCSVEQFFPVGETETLIVAHATEEKDVLA
jgi:hypothetical protein